MFRTKSTVWDFVSIAMVLLAAALIWLPFLHRDAAAVLVVTTAEGSTEYSLSEDREIVVTSRDHTLQIWIRDGTVFVAESACPDRVCVASGSIRYAGETILCAPAGVTLTVKGGDADVDFVAG